VTNGKGKVTICHVPPGNPENAHTITISVNALKTHLDHHDDYCGPCEEGGDDDDDDGKGKTGGDDDGGDGGISGIEIEFTFQQSGNSGILVIHAPGSSSRVKQFESNEDDPFTGLVITDYSFHHHIDILGAIVQLSPDLETAEDCSGNQHHWVRYSSRAISDATALILETTGIAIKGVTHKPTFGKGRRQQRHRWE
jgi:hypothetical protein